MSTPILFRSIRSNTNKLSFLLSPYIQTIQIMLKIYANESLLSDSLLFLAKNREQSFPKIIEIGEPRCSQYSKVMFLQKQVDS